VASIAPGPLPVKTEAALRVITPLLEAPVADRPDWTIPRLIAEIKTREGVAEGRCLGWQPRAKARALG